MFGLTDARHKELKTHIQETIKKSSDEAELFDAIKGYTDNENERYFAFMEVGIALTAITLKRMGPLALLAMM